MAAGVALFQLAALGASDGPAASVAARGGATVDVDAARVVGIVAPIHNLTEGPVTRSNWLVHSTRPDKSDKDYSAGFVRAGVGRSRTHGVGCIDMELLWRPFPRYEGQDATAPANYDWTVVDECVHDWYHNPELLGRQVEMFVRFGHSHANRSEYPAFSTPPDDFDVFASVCLHIVKHLNAGWDGGHRLAIRDWTVWNEPSSTVEISVCCPFWTGTAAEYASLYAKTRSAIRAEFGAVRVGAAVNSALARSCAPGHGHQCFDWHILGNISALGEPIDFVEFHFYGRSPQQFAWNIWQRPGELSLEGSLLEAGFPRKTPILLGEWSRFIPAYAMDAPGAAFLGCCLASFNSMHPANSAHALEDAFVFAAGKVWDGKTAGAPNLNAGVLWQAWDELVKGTPHLLQSTVTLAGPDWGHAAVASADGGRANSGCCELHVVAASDGKAAVSVFVANYNTTVGGGGRVPSIGAPHELLLRVANLPCARVAWKQLTQQQDGRQPVLAVAAQGSAAGPHFQQAVTVRGNAFSVVRIECEAM